MATIYKKCVAPYFDDVASGNKRVELRIADFELRDGDSLLLMRYNPEFDTFGENVERGVRRFWHLSAEELARLGMTPEAIAKHGVYLIELEDGDGT